MGTVVAMLHVEGEAPAATAPPAPLAPAAPRERVRVSRRLGGVRKSSADLSVIQGTGPEASITLDDVGRAAAPGRPSEAGPPDRTAAMRRAIAAAMSRSNREIPHYYLSTEVDMGGALEWLTAENAKRSVAERVLPAVLLLKAVALAARDVPEMNGFWTDTAFRPSPSIHLGVAISLRGGGLVTPALHDADRKPRPELMRDLSDLGRGRGRAR